MTTTLADQVNQWWKQHLAYTGPRKPYTEKQAQAIRAKLAKLDGDERLLAVSHYERHGFKTNIAKQYVPRLFELDGDEGVLAGYTDLSDWNGFEIPRVERAELEKFIAQTKKFIKLNGGDLCWAKSIKLDGDKLIITCDEQDGPTVEEPITIDTTDGKKKVWDISLGLCWMEADLCDICHRPAEERVQRVDWPMVNGRSPMVCDKCCPIDDSYTPGCYLCGELADCESIEGGKVICESCKAKEVR